MNRERKNKISIEACEYMRMKCNLPSLDDLIIKAFEDGAKWADQTMIEKACEWLYEYNRKQTDKMFGIVNTADVTINVTEFRKAMEGGCSEFPNNCEKGGEK